MLEGAIEVKLKRILMEACKVYGWLCHSLEVMSDHCHIFIQANHTTAPVEIAKTLKSIGAVHLFDKFPKLKQRKFWGSGLWSKGTYYASVGHISEDAVKKYIETQKHTAHGEVSRINRTSPRHVDGASRKEVKRYPSDVCLLVGLSSQGTRHMGF